MTTTNEGSGETKQEKLKRIIEPIDPSELQGGAYYNSVNSIMKQFKTKQSLGILKSLSISSPLIWDEVKEKVWESEEIQNQNKFPFAQGDLIATSKVDVFGKSRASQLHDLWLVKSPTCDAVRSDSCFVSPVWKIYNSYRKSTDPVEKTLYQNFRLACAFMSNRNFPIAHQVEDDEGHLGYYTDLSTIGFLPIEDREDVSIVCSLTFQGWLLLNILIQKLETRATIEDEVKMRPKGTFAN